MNMLEKLLIFMLVFTYISTSVLAYKVITDKIYRENLICFTK